MSQEIKNVQVFQRENGTRITWNYYNSDCELILDIVINQEDAETYVAGLTEYEQEESVVIIDELGSDY